MKKLMSLISAMLISTSLINTGAISVNGYSVSLDSTGTNWEDIKNQSDYSVTVDGREMCYIFLKDTKWPLDYNCYTISKNYFFSVITVDESSYEPDVLTEMFGQDYSIFYDDEINRHYFRYSEEFDYGELYKLPFVQKVELYKRISYSTWRHCINLDPAKLKSINDPWFDNNEYNMDRRFYKTMLHKFTATSDTELTDEMFSDFDAEYVHVFKAETDEEKGVSYWEAYYNITDDYSIIRKFDDYVQNIDGVLSSGGYRGLGLYSEEQSGGELNGEFVEVLRPDEITGSQTLYGDVDADDTVDLSDLTKLSQYLLKDIELEADQIKCADVNADNEVNLQDLALLKQYVMNDDVQLDAAVK